MGNCLAIPEVLPEGTIQTPPVALYLSDDAEANIYYITVGLYPNGKIYLLHWSDKMNIPVRKLEILGINTHNRNVVCNLENGEVTTFKRLSSGDIVNLDMETIAFRSDMGDNPFYITPNPEFNKLSLLFTDRIVGRTRKGVTETREAVPVSHSPKFDSQIHTRL